jgi:uncharacterized protein (DUF924 family)
LKFWFEEIKPKQWFASDPAFDALVRERFLVTLQQAMAGELYEWRRHAEGRLAEVIVLDQFSRNIFRGRPEAFAQDPMALALSQEAVAAGSLRALESPQQRSFLLMPFMHSESRVIHEQAVPLFRAYAPSENYDYELRHQAVIERFGHYPSRNRILGRTSSPEEAAFLEEHGSGF